MFDFYVQPNFLLSEFACSHCRKKYKENRDNTRPEMKMFAQAVRDELN